MLIALFILTMSLLNAGVAWSASADMICAAKDRRTAPSYVLIIVINTNSQQRFQSAVPADTLQMALAMEHGIKFDSSLRDYQAVYHLIDEHPDLVFRFSWGPAIELVRPPYTEAMLSEARTALASLNNEIILNSHSAGGALQRLYNRPWPWQEALAHVLLERGLFPGRGDYVPFLYISAWHPAKSRNCEVRVSTGCWGVKSCNHAIQLAGCGMGSGCGRNRARATFLP